MKPVFLIDATNSVCKYITTQDPTIQFGVSFNLVLLCKYLVSLPRLFPSCNVT